MVDEKDEAASSAAPEVEVPKVETTTGSVTTELLSSLTEEQYATYMRDGEESLPKPEPAKVEVKAEEVPEVVKEEVKAGDKKPRSERRADKIRSDINEALKDRHNVRDALEKLGDRTIDEYVADELKKHASVTETAKPEPAKAEPVKPAEFTGEDAADPEPKPEDFSGDNAWSDYRKAERAWDRRVVQRQIEHKQAEQRQQSEARKADDTAAESWKKQMDRASKTYADFGEVALAAIPDMQKQGEISMDMLSFIATTEEAGAEVLYYLATNREESARIAKMGPHQTVRALSRIEMKLTGETTEPKKEAPAAVLPPKTRAPRPTPTVTGAHVESGDAEEAALARGDYAEFNRLANARELAEMGSTRR